MLKFTGAAARGILAVSAVLALSACRNMPDMVYRPYPQILPQHIVKIAVQTFVNKTDYFGLEDRLNLKLTDEFLRDGTYTLVPQDQADGIVVGEITRYILTPVQYDVAMVPTLYKLNVLLKVQFYDKKTGQYLWTEPALEGIQNYSAATLPGGMTEEQARDAVWAILSKDIVTRTVQGFGSVTSQSSRRIAYSDPVSSDTVKMLKP